MVRNAIVCGVLLAVSTGCSHGGSDPMRSEAEPTGQPTCSVATAASAARVTISPEGPDHSCVKVSRKVGFTLLNLDTTRHDFSTTKDAPTPLRVELKKGAAFPYTFVKRGTYRFEDTRSDLVLTVIVP